jgi:hypothetical protein
MRGFETRVLSGAYLAHGAVARAVAKGELPRAHALSCTDCGAQASEYDHRDYSQPLVVEPVCRLHNRRRGRAKPHHDPVAIARRYVRSSAFAYKLKYWYWWPQCFGNPWLLFPEELRAVAVAAYMSSDSEG